MTSPVTLAAGLARRVAARSVFDAFAGSFDVGRRQSFILAVQFEVTVAGEERARVTRYGKPDPRRKTSLDQSAPRLS